MVSTWSMGIAMEYEELYEKYKKLLGEVNRLTEENSQLRAQLGLTKSETPQLINTSSIKSEINYRDDDSISDYFPDVNNTSDSLIKVRLFMSLFKGRDDVYAKRWENKNKEKFGYAPVCLNLWQAGVCKKPEISCSKCKNKDYAVLDEDVIENHLRIGLLTTILSRASHL
jgi:hypothetical protein